MLSVVCMMVVGLAVGGCLSRIIFAVIKMTDYMHVGSNRVETQYRYQQKMYETSAIHRLTIAILPPFFMAESN